MERRGMDGWPWPSPLPPPSVGGGGHLPPSLPPSSPTLTPTRRRGLFFSLRGGGGGEGQGKREAVDTKDNHSLLSLSLPQPQTPFSFPLFLLLLLFSPPIATLPKHCLLSYASLPLLFPRRRRLRTQLPSSSSCFPPSSPLGSAPVFSYCV